MGGDKHSVQFSAFATVVDVSDVCVTSVAVVLELVSVSLTSQV